MSTHSRKAIWLSIACKEGQELADEKVSAKNAMLNWVAATTSSALRGYNRYEREYDSAHAQHNPPAPLHHSPRLSPAPQLTRPTLAGGCGAAKGAPVVG